MPVIFYFYNHNHDPRHLVPLVFAIVLAIALVSFYLVEVPLQAFLKGSRKVVPLGEA
jgi:peptidoglycan/LPS O-acetylase OafA/YrhL